MPLSIGPFSLQGFGSSGKDLLEVVYEDLIIFVVILGFGIISRKLEQVESDGLHAF